MSPDALQGLVIDHQSFQQSSNFAGGSDQGSLPDPMLEDLRLRNLMRRASYGDPVAQFDLGVEAMLRIVGGEKR